MSQITSSALRKICATCGRQISWRKKWEKNWDAITYCSDSCRKNKIKPGSLDISFESKILELLRKQKISQGAAAAVVTCEEAEASVLHGLRIAKLNAAQEDAGEESWEPPARARERCRQAARRLAEKGEIVVTQEGKTVDPSFAKGVMELKLP